LVFPVFPISSAYGCHFDDIAVPVNEFHVNLGCFSRRGSTQSRYLLAEAAFLDFETGGGAGLLHAMVASVLNSGRWIGVSTGDIAAIGIGWSGAQSMRAW
jgi:hypothetical protein